LFSSELKRETVPLCERNEEQKTIALLLAREGGSIFSLCRLWPVLLVSSKGTRFSASLAA